MKKQLFGALALSVGAAALFINATSVSSKEASALKFNTAIVAFATTDSAGDSGGGESGGASGENNSGNGWGYSENDVQCKSPDYDATVSTSTNTGSGAAVYVEAGGPIGTTGITAGVSGNYYTGAGSSTIVTHKSPTTKTVCAKASWYNYCSPHSCRYIP
jgi:hypothetical protein